MISTEDIVNVKRDLNDIGECINGNETGVVNPRLGDSFSTLPVAIASVENKGGYITAPNLAALNAIVPEYNHQVARLDDTGNEYRWNPAASPPQWVATGRNFIQDSINYTNAALPITTSNLYTAANNISNLYVQPSTGSLLTQSGNAITYFPVRAGKTYAIKASDVRTAYLVVSLSSTNTATSGKQQTLVTLNTTSDPNILTFTVPANSDFKYAFTNVLWPNFNFDIRSSLVVQEGNTITDTVASIRGKGIEDTVARSGVIALENKNFVSANDIIKTVNFYSNSTDTANLYLASDTALMTTLSGTALGRWAVEAGKTYTVKSTKFLATAIVGLSPDSSATSGKATTRVLLTDTADPLVKTFTVPTGSTAKFAFFTVLLPSQNYDVRTTLVVNAGVAKIVDEINGAAITDAIAQAKIKILEENQAGNTYLSILKNKKWVFIGDSITASNNGWATVRYHDYVVNAVGGMTTQNLGVSSSGYGDRTLAASAITLENPDYITIFMGTNDFGFLNDYRNSQGTPYPLGTFLSSTNLTVSGAINLTLTNIFSAFPLAKVAIITPLPRGSLAESRPNYGENPTPNVDGVNLEMIANELIRYAKHYSLPYLDLYHHSNFLASSVDFQNACMTDGVHPNDVGHAIIGQKVLKFLESI